MEVNGPGSVHGAYPVNHVRPSSEVRPTSEATPASPQDEVEISTAGRMLDQLSQTSAFRAERLAQIKAEIEAGTYDTDEKLEAAFAKLLGQIDFDA